MAGWVLWWLVGGREETKAGIPSIRPAENVHISRLFFCFFWGGGVDVPLTSLVVVLSRLRASEESAVLELSGALSDGGSSTGCVDGED